MKHTATVGMLAAVGAYGWWGIIAPLYFFWTRDLSAWTVLGMRILWSVPVLVLAAALVGRLSALRTTLASPKLLASLALTGTLVGANWFIFIIAVSSGRTLDASLGYYLNPLVSVALGVLLLREQLSRAQWVAVGFALLGIIWMITTVGGVPWIAMALAVSFGLYGLLRKQLNVDPISGLFAESVILLPLAAVLLVLYGPGSSTDTGRLALAGPVTVVPLLFFVIGARRLKLSTIGMLQYLAPTGQFLCALLIFGEPLPAARLIAFAIVWCGLALFAWDGLSRHRRERSQTVEILGRAASGPNPP